MRMNILYFGDPQGAIELLKRNLNLCGVVHGRKGGPGWMKLLPQLKNTPRFLEPNLKDPGVVAKLAALRPDMIVSGFYPHRIPKAVLDLAPGLNVHPSDLPRWRGPDPCSWAIRAGDRETAICVQKLAEGLDEGDVYLREKLEIGERETGGHLAERMEKRAAELLAEVVDRMARGEHFEAQPQQGEVTWAKMLDPEALEIDWTKPADEVDAWIRAASPDPGAFTGIGDELLVVLLGLPIEGGVFQQLQPGTSFIIDGEACIRCGEGALRLDRVRLGRRNMTGRELARLL